MDGIIDFDIEKDRLQKRINELKMHLVNVKKKLENKDFLNRAPENVIRHEKEKKENMILFLNIIQRFVFYTMKEGIYLIILVKELKFMMKKISIS